MHNLILLFLLLSCRLVDSVAEQSNYTTIKEANSVTEDKTKNIKEIKKENTAEAKNISKELELDIKTGIETELENITSGNAFSTKLIDDTEEVNSTTEDETKNTEENTTEAKDNVSKELELDIKTEIETELANITLGNAPSTKLTDVSMDCDIAGEGVQESTPKSLDFVKEENERSISNKFKWIQKFIDGLFIVFIE